MMVLSSSAFSTSRRYYSTATPPHTDTDIIEYLVQQRLQARKVRDFAEADRLKALLEAYDVVLVDFPYSKGGHTTWTFQQRHQEVPECSLMKLARYVVVTVFVFFTLMTPHLS